MNIRTIDASKAEVIFILGRKYGLDFIDVALHELENGASLGMVICAGLKHRKYGLDFIDVALEELENGASLGMAICAGLKQR